MEHPVTADDIDFAMSILARGDAENLVHRRMVVRDLKQRSKHHRVSRVFDLEADLEKSLMLLECLPQSSRATDPPQHAFLQLARAVSGEVIHPETILERAILLEEYALNLVNTRTEQGQRRHKGAAKSPWSMLSKTNEGLPTEGAVTHSGRSTVSQICRLLEAISFRDRKGNVRSLSRSTRHRRQKGRNRSRPKKRRRQDSASPGANSTAEEREDEGSSGSYSSDYYTDNSDEEG